MPSLGQHDGEIARGHVEDLHERGLAGAREEHAEREADGAGDLRRAVVVGEGGAAERGVEIEGEGVDLDAIERVAVIVGDAEAHGLAQLGEDDLDLVATTLVHVDGDASDDVAGGVGARDGDDDVLGDGSEGEGAVVRGEGGALDGADRRDELDAGAARGGAILLDDAAFERAAVAKDDGDVDLAARRELDDLALAVDELGVTNEHLNTARA